MTAVVFSRRLEPGLIEFRTEPGATFRLTAVDR
jgi:hypothetical protein